MTNSEFPTFTADDSPMDVLVKLSRHYGGDVEMVLAGGGNTSAKIDGNLLIKASGFALSSIGPEGFVELRRGPLLELLDAELPEDVDEREAMYKRVSLSARVHPELGQRPSVECLLHNLIPATYVVHSHATLVNMLTSCVRGRELCEELLGAEALWVPFVDPGIVLGRELKRRLDEYARSTGRSLPDAIVMESHGLIVAGDEPGEIRERTDRVLRRIRERLDAVGGAEAPFGEPAPVNDDDARVWVDRIAPTLRGLLAEAGRLPVVTFCDDADVLRLTAAPGGREAAEGGALNPDEIVYCRRFPMWVCLPDRGDDEAVGEALSGALEDFRRRRGLSPTIVLVEKLGLFAVGGDFKSADTARAVYVDQARIFAGAKRLGGIRHLPDRDAEFIENWELESYRRKVAAGDRPSGKADGKVALVTGAAQGFGRQIAEDLSAQGAHVALADVNVEGALSVASAICRAGGSGRALGVEMNVTESASVAEAIHGVVRAYGGLDVLISNAGVLRAQSVKTQSERDFDFVTDVNYKGYFLCVQASAPVFARQRSACPGATFDVIQINSKSGLVGSNKNFAYAGSKFGGVGLTQSFALELIEDGVKVNSICPGNFFDGPLWSDPDNGLFVQYLRAGKVPGAQTIADVRAAYESKVPMGRGCTTADVMKAVYYLIEQQYETGQAVPVTGGQVMLR
jgi:rhamnose utilization protein RhaD (predicted bifunctional aldolase and dehydrogenase)/NAD(P)-dependent dehydrogenase (short-subunit alcohol dehydrogenase family)